MAVEWGAIVAAIGKAVTAIAEKAAEALAHAGSELAIDSGAAGVDAGSAAGQGADAGVSGMSPSGAETAPSVSETPGRYDADTLWGRSEELPFGTGARADFDLPKGESTSPTPKTQTDRAGTTSKKAPEPPGKRDTPDARAERTRRQQPEQAPDETLPEPKAKPRAQQTREPPEPPDELHSTPDSRARSTPNQPPEPEVGDQGPLFFYDDLSREERAIIDAEMQMLILEEQERIGKQTVIGLGGKVMTQAEYDRYVERELKLLKLDTMSAIAQSPLAAFTLAAAVFATDDEAVLNQLANQAAQVESTISGKNRRNRRRAHRGPRRPSRRAIVRAALTARRRRRQARLRRLPPNVRHSFRSKALGKIREYSQKLGRNIVRPLRLGAHRRYGLTYRGIQMVMEATYLFKRSTGEVEVSNSREMSGRPPPHTSKSSEVAHDLAQQFMLDYNSATAKVKAEPRLVKYNKTRGDLSISFPDQNIVMEFKRTAWVENGKLVNQRGPINPQQIESLEMRAIFNNTKVFVASSDGRIFGYHPPSRKWEHIN